MKHPVSHLFKRWLAMLMLAIAVNMSYADETQNGITYALDSSTLTASVIGCNESELSSTVVIPSKITSGSAEYTVTSIGQDAFDSCHDITSLTIGNKVT